MRADRRADRHLVVVEDDQQLRLAVADVVQGLEAEARQQRGVADDHRDPLHRVPDVAGGGQALRDGHARARVAAVHDVVRRLAAAREAADAVDLAQGAEAVQAPREQLVRIRLVPGVPDDLVARRLEEPVQGERDLDHAQRRAEVAAGHGDGPDDGLADLGGELDQLRLRQAAKLRGVLEAVEDRHGRWLLLLGWASRLGRPGARPGDASARSSPVSPRQIGPRYLLSDRSTMVWHGPAGGPGSPLLDGLVGTDVHGFERPVGAGHQLLDAELRLGQEPLAAALERDRPLVLGDGGLEGRAARSRAPRRPAAAPRTRRRRRAPRRRATGAVAGPGASVTAASPVRSAPRPSWTGSRGHDPVDPAGHDHTHEDSRRRSSGPRSRRRR